MMRYFIPREWRHIMNTEGTYSVFPVEAKPGKELVATVFREDDARIIASAPEMYTALFYAVKTLRATEAFMTDKGLETNELKEIIGVISRLLDRIDGTE